MNSSDHILEASHPPPTMCIGRLSGNYCPFGDPSDCECLDLFSHSINSLSDISEDVSYMEEVLDDLYLSLMDTSAQISSPRRDDATTSTASDYDSEDQSTTSDLQSQFLHKLQLTSTPVRHRSCANPVLASIVSPVFGDSTATQFKAEKQSVFEDQNMSGMNSVLRSCELDDSLELFGMTRLKEDDVCMTDRFLQAEDTFSMDVNDPGWWALEGPYTNTKDCTMSQLLLPNTHSAQDTADSSLFFF